MSIVPASSTPAPLDATLRLLFSKSLSGSIKVSVPATIRVQTGGKIWKQIVMIPAGPSGVEPVAIGVPHGVYVVEVVLPSGNRVTAEGEIARDEKKDVTLQERGSRQPWLSWSSYAVDGDFVKSHEWALPTGPRDDPGSALESFEIRDTGPALEAMAQPATTLRDVMGPRGRVRFWQRRREGQWQPIPAEVHLGGKDRQAVMLRVPPHGPLPDAHLLAEVVGLQEQLSEFTIVPWRWPDEHDGNAEVEILIDSLQTDTESPSSGKLRVRATVQDSNFAQLSGYLTRGDIKTLKAVNEHMAPQAEALFARKIECPLLATAAALALLKTRQLDLLHDWTRNLAAWFPTLPDGPVIRAWHLLYARESGNAKRQDSETPLRHLLDGAQRGLPVFAESLRLLVEGLRLFKSKSPNNEEVGKSLETMEAFLWAAGAGEEFASFRGSAPNAPGSRSSQIAARGEAWSFQWDNDA
jgi:hypothetical protein